jgi:hypothetical protein
VKHLILALLATTFSLSVTAATNLNSSKSNVTEEREAALQGADTCKFTIDEKGVKRLAQPQKECKTFNESRSNSLRGAAPAGKPKSSEAGIAVSDPGVPNDKNTAKK